jgi:hypothetical protein
MRLLIKCGVSRISRQCLLGNHRDISCSAPFLSSNPSIKSIMSYYPASAPQLPYPWSSHYDSNYDALYFSNSETGESRWTHPFESAQDVQGGNYNSDSYSTNSAPATTSYASGGQAPATGAASSFYGSEPPVQSSQYNNPYPDQTQGQPDANAEPGERGLGKVVAGGAVLYMGYKMLKKYQNKQSHSGYPQMGQSYGAAPQYGQGMPGGMMGAGGLGGLLGGFGGFGKRDMESTPALSSGYGPPATAPPIFGDAPYQVSRQSLTLLGAVADLLFF